MELKELEQLEELTASVSKEHNREVYGRYDCRRKALNDCMEMFAEETGSNLNTEFLHDFFDYNHLLDEAVRCKSIVQVCTSKNVYYIVLRSKEV